MMTKDIVYEKEKRLKEFMHVMGLSNGIHWLAWFFTAFIAMYTVTFLLALILKYGKITQSSDISVLFVFFCCFTMATTTECFLFSVFFNRANIAAVIAGILYFILFLPYSLLVRYADTINISHKFLACLSPSVAFGYGCDIIAQYELQTQGATWKNFYTNPYLSYESFSMNDVCLILLFDSFVYMVLAWYIEAVFPGEFGVSKRWYFLFKPSYWLGSKIGGGVRKRRGERRRGGGLKEKLLSNFALSRMFETFFGMVSKHEIIRRAEDEYKNSDKYKFVQESIENIKESDDYGVSTTIDEEAAGIEIENMHKVYKRGSNHALKGLSVKFYKNEISAFLGHNGAGKSTTMHLLTGLYKPTSGDAKVNGK